MIGPFTLLNAAMLPGASHSLHMPDACSSLQANASCTRARALVEHGYMVISFTPPNAAVFPGAYHSS